MASTKKTLAAGLREQSAPELKERLDAAKKELFNMRVKSVTKELTNPNLIREKRREIARLNLVLAEKTNA